MQIFDHREIDMSIGENLRKARNAKGVSQAAIAEKVGAGKTTYIGWEHDTNPPPADKLVDLAKELGVSVEGLLFGDDGGISAEMMDIFRRFDALPANAKTQARMLLRALLFTLENGTDGKAEVAA
ncbi:helix-turn-helix domain-containing protein [Pseudomonas sp. Pseu.R1]|uniref:helix-turn-helix domain-containing protein n=1 Tax=Pseudomonas sp. Pseu.R1 TaxID=3379818 RepID=UPI003B940EF9